MIKRLQKLISEGDLEIALNELLKEAEKQEYIRYKKEALTYYQQLKERDWPDNRYDTFCEVFLADIKELEEAGITHPDVEKIRDYLGECKN